MARWVIDALYGGRETGHIGKKGRLEKNIVLDAAMEAMKILKHNDEDVFLIRENDSYIEINERLEWAKKWKADYYICLAMNFDEDENVKGTEVYINQRDETSRELGNIVLADMSLSFGNENTGVKENDNPLLDKLDIPIIICLGDYISNEEVEKNFNAKKYGRIVARACVKYVGKIPKNEFKLTVHDEERRKVQSGWKVCTGFYSDFDDAKKALENVKSRGISGAYIIPDTKRK